MIFSFYLLRFSSTACRLLKFIFCKLYYNMGGLAKNRHHDPSRIYTDKASDEFLHICVPKSSFLTAAPESGHRNGLDFANTQILQAAIKKESPAGLFNTVAKRVQPSGIMFSDPER